MMAITSDWDEVDHELDRLAMMPTPKTTSLLDTALDYSFGLTQAAVHVVTGRLKAGGRVIAGGDMLDAGWTGEISYSAINPEDGVDYAIYEKRRGAHWLGKSDVRGSHDFFAPLETVEPVFVAAILEGLS